MREGDVEGKGFNVNGYDGKSNCKLPLRLIQHYDEPCWQAHAYLRFIQQPYWTENIELKVVMGVDTPVLVDRHFVMSACPAIRCMEEIAASSLQDCNPSFQRYNAVKRVEGMWHLLEATMESESTTTKRKFSLRGLNSMSKLYSNMKKHFYLLSETPAYLSSTELLKLVDTSYNLLSEYILNPMTEWGLDTPTSEVADGIYFLSGCSTPGLADSLLFSHLMEVSTSEAMPWALSRLRTEFPVLYKYFLHICEAYFHPKDKHTCQVSRDLLLQSNWSLYQCLLVSREKENLSEEFVKLLFGENFFLSGPNFCLQSRSSDIVLIPHHNEPTRILKTPLFKSKYSFPPVFLTNIIGKYSANSDNEYQCQSAENYIGFRCLFFTAFVVGCFVKSAVDIMKR